MAKKKKFELMHRFEDGHLINGIFIDDEYFDWEIDKDSLNKVIETGDPNLIKMAKADIERHFLESISEFVGRRVTSKELKEAEKTGWL